MESRWRASSGVGLRRDCGVSSTLRASVLKHCCHAQSYSTCREGALANLSAQETDTRCSSTFALAEELLFARRIGSTGISESLPPGLHARWLVYRFRTVRRICRAGSSCKLLLLRPHQLGNAPLVFGRGRGRQAGAGLGGLASGGRSGALRGALAVLALLALQLCDGHLRPPRDGHCTNNGQLPHQLMRTLRRHIDAAAEGKSSCNQLLTCVVWQQATCQFSEG